jgi:beta-carotene hydroxylase
MLRLMLHIFPLLQVAAFGIAVLLIFAGYHVAALFMVMAGGLLLNFSLHITVHHFVHFSFKKKWINRLFSFYYTLLLGLPFHFYKMQHYNHHRYDNRIGDLTSTWKMAGGKIVPKNFFGYCFFWFIKGSSKKGIRLSLANGDLTQHGFTLLRLELVMLALFYGLLAWINPWVALAYLLQVYVGWSLIAITNYGQHLPVSYDQPVAYSFANRVYNRLFFNNGLHLEHHEKPWLDYDQLEPSGRSAIRLPHLLAGFSHHKITRNE